MANVTRDPSHAPMKAIRLGCLRRVSSASMFSGTCARDGVASGREAIPTSASRASSDWGKCDSLGRRMPCRCCVRRRLWYVSSVHDAYRRAHGVGEGASCTRSVSLCCTSPCRELVRRERLLCSRGFEHRCWRSIRSAEAVGAVTWFTNEGSRAKVIARGNVE